MPRLLDRALGALALLACALGLTAAFRVPPDAVQGEIQRLMYLHVPLILVSYLAFGLAGLMSGLYLWRRAPATDAWAAAAAEVGVLCTALAIAAGSIWGRPTWGTWWTWDARLTTTAILLLIFLGYLMLRALIEDPARGATLSAVLALLGVLDIPIIHFSVVWWRTLHQPASLLRPGPGTVAPIMRQTLALNLVAIGLLAAYLLVKRRRLEALRAELLRRQRAVA